VIVVVALIVIAINKRSVSLKKKIPQNPMLFGIRLNGCLDCDNETIRFTRRLHSIGHT